MRVRFAPLAEAEVDEADAWYSGRQSALGIDFRAEVDRVAKLIGENPQMYPVGFGRMRRAMLDRFPYFLIYEVFQDVILVFGVIHGARDPQVWMMRGDA